MPLISEPEELMLAREAHLASLVHVQSLASWEQLNCIHSDWERILKNSEQLTMFSTPEWLGAWWKAYGQNRRLTALTFNMNGEMIGLAPLFADELALRTLGKIRRLRLVGDGTHDSDNLDLIFERQRATLCSNALLSWLDRNSDWDVCELNTFHEALSSLGELRLALKERKWPVMESGKPHSVVHLPDSWESFLAQLPKKFGRGLDHATAALSSRYSVRSFRCSNEDELGYGLDALFALHQKRWKSKREPGAFAQDCRRSFYTDLSRRLLRCGRLEFWLLQLNGNAVAAQFSFRYRDTVYHLQEGVDPDYLAERAGVALRVHVLKQLIQEGVRDYDFLGGTDAHKRLWRARAGLYKGISFARPLTRGALYLKMKEIAMGADTWMHAHLPSSAFKVLRWIYRGTHGQGNDEMAVN